MPNFPQDLGINLYLFGNGFKLVGAFEKNGSKDSDVRLLKKLLKRAIAANLLSENFESKIQFKRPDNGDGKLALIGGAFEMIDAMKKSSDGSGSGDFLRAAEGAEAEPTALWYPCVLRGGIAVPNLKLGDSTEYQEYKTDGNTQPPVKVATHDEAALRCAFPLTSTRWTDATRAAIFNNVPARRVLELGRHYLEGSVGQANCHSFATEVLIALATSQRR